MRERREETRSQRARGLEFSVPEVRPPWVGRTRRRPPRAASGRATSSCLSIVGLLQDAMLRRLKYIALLLFLLAFPYGPLFPWSPVKPGYRSERFARAE